MTMIYFDTSTEEAVARFLNQRDREINLKEIELKWKLWEARQKTISVYDREQIDNFLEAIPEEE